MDKLQAASTIRSSAGPQATRVNFLSGPETSCFQCSLRTLEVFCNFDDRITANRALLAFYNLIGSHFINFVYQYKQCIVYIYGRK